MQGQAYLCVGRVFDEFLKNVCTRIGGDVQIVCKSRAVGGWARERMLLARFL